MSIVHMECQWYVITVWSLLAWELLQFEISTLTTRLIISTFNGWNGQCHVLVVLKHLREYVEGCVKFFRPCYRLDISCRIGSWSMFAKKDIFWFNTSIRLWNLSKLWYGLNWLSWLAYGQPKIKSKNSFSKHWSVTSLKLSLKKFGSP